MKQFIRGMRDKTLSKLKEAHRASGGAVHENLGAELMRKANMITTAKLAGPTVLATGVAAKVGHSYVVKKRHGASVHSVVN